MYLVNAFMFALQISDMRNYKFLGEMETYREKLGSDKLKDSLDVKD